MSLENLTGPNTGFNDLVPTNPDGTDPVSEGDNHIRGVKNVTVNVLGPMVSAAVSLPAVDQALMWDGVKYIPKTIASGLAAATQTQMEAAASNAVAVTPGVAKFAPSACKAWAVFNGTGTILAGFNVTSVTKNANNLFTPNLTVPFSSANHVPMYSFVRAAGGSTAPFTCFMKTAPLAGTGGQIAFFDALGGVPDSPDLIMYQDFGDQ